MILFATLGSSYLSMPCLLPYMAPDHKDTVGSLKSNLFLPLHGFLLLSFMCMGSLSWCESNVCYFPPSYIDAVTLLLLPLLFVCLRVILWLGTWCECWTMERVYDCNIDPCKSLEVRIFPESYQHGPLHWELVGHEGTLEIEGQSKENCSLSPRVDLF